MRKLIITLVVVLLTLWVSGCSAPPQPGQEAEVTQREVTAESAAAAPTATPTEKAETERTEVEVGPTTAEVDVAEAADEPAEEDTGMALRSMDEFDSYRQQVKLMWEVAGQGVSQTDILQEYVREPPASRSVITVAGTDEPANTVETVQVGDTVYTKVGDDWFASMREGSEDEAQQYLAWANPYEFMSSGDCRLVGMEQVGGLDAKHYACGQELLAASQAAMPGGLSSAITLGTADTWVSTEYEVAIRTLIHWEGEDADGNAVTYTYESTAYDINEPISIEPPEGTEAPDVPDDIPMIDGATDVQISGQPPVLIISFEVAVPASDVIAFYNDAMPGQGWTGQASPIPGMANFEKDGRTAMIATSEAGGTTTATIMIGAQ